MAVLVGRRCSIPLPHDVWRPPRAQDTKTCVMADDSSEMVMLLGVAARRGGLMSSTHRHCMAQTSAAVAALLLASITNTTCCLAMAALSVHAITDSTSRRPAPRKLAAKCSAHSPTAHVVEAWASDVAQDVYRPGYMYSPKPKNSKRSLLTEFSAKVDIFGAPPLKSTKILLRPTRTRDAFAIEFATTKDIYALSTS